MEEIIVLLLIIILALLINFRNYVTGRLKKLESDIRQLQNTYSSTIAQFIKPVAKQETSLPPKKPEKDYWESSFKVMDEPVIQAPAQENIPEQKTNEKQETIEPKIPVRERKIHTPAPVVTAKPTFFEKNPDLEKFIGENLVSKIGIAILVLAIGFFVKFAIDNNWIGPVGRVSIGILCGGILVFLAHRLRNSYKAFSSVLAGGGLAVFYFTITLAYHQFNLFSQTTAFIIMIVITVFAVLLSILYNRQELAIIALVGGFAAPFLVSNGSGNYKVLFTYLLILNTGLLVIAYNKAWRLMNLLAFIFTAILFTGWLGSLSSYTTANVYVNGLLFATCFYLLFFLINIANNIKENKRFIAADFSILLINTGLYFAAGLYCLSVMHKPEYRGLFTIFIGVFNLIASYFLFRKRKVDINILYLFIGITLTFISLAAPIQLHGNYITLFWASEAVLLYWLFQKSKIEIIQYASLIVWIAMLISLLMDWKNIYGDKSVALAIIINKGFITGLYTAVATYILFILKNKTAASGNYLEDKIIPKNIFHNTGIILLFINGALEMNHQCLYSFPGLDMNVLYLQLYSFAFVLLLLFINNKVAEIKMSITTQIFLLVGCILFFAVTSAIITRLQSQLLQEHLFTVYFHVCWVNAILMAIIFYRLIQIEKAKSATILISYEMVVWLTSAVIVLFLSFESFWMVNNIFFNTQNDLAELQRVFIKTCLPILWGLCSFCFMWLGMKYKFKPLRIISLALFLITLLKLFIFDISNIPVAGKIAAFFCLGVLLLIVSFMYQRLKKIIIQDEEKNLYKIFICLISFFVTEKVESQNSFKYKAPLQNVAATHLYAIDLPPEVIAKCKDDISDLRIFDEEGKQVSYILENDLPVFKKENFIEFPVTKVSKEKDKQTHIVIRNKSGKAINNLLLFIKNMDAARNFSLTGSDDSIHWFIIKENIYFQNAFSTDGDNIINTLSFPNSSYKYLQLIILGENVIPFNIVKAGIYNEDLVYGKYVELPEPLIIQKDSSDKKSYVTLKFNDTYQVNKFIIDAAGPKYFRRSFSVSEGNKDKYDYLLDAYIISESQNSFIINSKDNNLLLIIKNEDDVPLKLKTVKCFQLNIKMVTYLQANKKYSLYFGDSTSQLPKYDLRFFKDTIEKDADDLSVFAIEKNAPGNNNGNSVPHKNSKIMLWGILITVLSILLFFTFRMMAEIDKKKGPHP